jgi:hypothetical protein
MEHRGGGREDDREGVGESEGILRLAENEGGGRGEGEGEGEEEEEEEEDEDRMVLKVKEQ